MKAMKPSKRESDDYVAKLLSSLLRREFQDEDEVAVVSDMTWYAAWQGYSPEDVATMAPADAREMFKTWAAMRKLTGDSEDAYPEHDILETPIGKRWAAIRMQVIRSLLR